MRTTRAGSAGPVGRGGTGGDGGVGAGSAGRGGGGGGNDDTADAQPAPAAQVQDQPRPTLSAAERASVAAGRLAEHGAALDAAAARVTACQRALVAATEAFTTTHGRIASRAELAETLGPLEAAVEEQRRLLDAPLPGLAVGELLAAVPRAEEAAAALLAPTAGHRTAPVRLAQGAAPDAVAVALLPTPLPPSEAYALADALETALQGVDSDGELWALACALLGTQVQRLCGPFTAVSQMLAPLHADHVPASVRMRLAMALPILRAPASATRMGGARPPAHEAAGAAPRTRADDDIPAVDGAWAVGERRACTVAGKSRWCVRVGMLPAAVVLSKGVTTVDNSKLVLALLTELPLAAASDKTAMDAVARALPLADCVGRLRSATALLQGRWPSLALAVPTAMVGTWPDLVRLQRQPDALGGVSKVTCPVNDSGLVMAAFGKLRVAFDWLCGPHNGLSAAFDELQVALPTWAGVAPALAAEAVDEGWARWWRDVEQQALNRYTRDPSGPTWRTVRLPPLRDYVERCFTTLRAQAMWAAAATAAAPPAAPAAVKRPRRAAGVCHNAARGKPCALGAACPWDHPDGRHPPAASAAPGGK